MKKLKDDLKDWWIPAILLIPHTILLVAIWLSVSESAMALKETISAAGNIATLIGATAALMALSTWRKNEKYKEIKEHRKDIFNDIFMIQEEHREYKEFYFEEISEIVTKNIESDEPMEDKEKLKEVSEAIIQTISSKTNVYNERFIKLIDTAHKLKQKTKLITAPMSNDQIEDLNVLVKAHEKINSCYLHMSLYYSRGRDMRNTIKEKHASELKDFHDGKITENFTNIVQRIEKSYLEDLERF